MSEGPNSKDPSGKGSEAVETIEIQANIGNGSNDLKEDEALTSQKTAAGNIDFNLEEEFAIIEQYTRMCEGKKTHDAQGNATQQSIEASPISSKHPTRTKGKKKAAQGQELSTTKRSQIKMQNDKVAKEQTYEDNSDDAQSNDEEEARLTWDIGKMLGLKVANEEQVKESLLTLRRSNRKRTNKGVEGCH
ncbi:hypothetical protein RIF29_41877 [Crotalaria pallida]|uniref:Uncharacterized protein n=1 Tax=Crotalaria pallida TaxID=3830 RepID=A0AAN9E856_CROPI